MSTLTKVFERSNWRIEAPQLVPEGYCKKLPIKRIYVSSPGQPLAIATGRRRALNAVDGSRPMGPERNVLLDTPLNLKLEGKS